MFKYAGSAESKHLVVLRVYESVLAGRMMKATTLPRSGGDDDIGCHLPQREGWV